MTGRALLVLAFGSCFSAAAAETLYVTDVLRLGIHAAADTSDPPFATLVSGAALEVLERAPQYVRVRTADGREGWVKSAYLVTTKPALARVAELEAELDALRGEAAAARAAKHGAEQEAARLGAAASSGEAVRDRLDRLEHENAAYQARLEAYRGSLPWTWVGAALLLALAAGFVAGIWWLDALIRRRHGGFRIY
jgi:SH3 domain protein